MLTSSVLKTRCVLQIAAGPTCLLYMNTKMYVYDLSGSVLLRMRNVPDTRCRENKNTHFVFNNLFFSFENRAVYEICGKIR